MTMQFWLLGPVLQHEVGSSMFVHWGRQGRGGVLFGWVVVWGLGGGFFSFLNPG